MPMCEWMNQRSTLQICLPAGNGVFNALSLARHYAALLPGGVDGVTLLSEDTVKKATGVSATVIRPEGTFANGLGYALGAEGFIFGSRNTLFGHGGYGGSVAFADLENDFAMAVTKNYFHNNSAEMEIIRAVQEMLLCLSPDSVAKDTNNLCVASRKL